jgi:hypothetical protein
MLNLEVIYLWVKDKVGYGEFRPKSFYDNSQMKSHIQKNVVGYVKAKGGVIARTQKKL